MIDKAKEYRENRGMRMEVWVRVVPWKTVYSGPTPMLMNMFAENPKKNLRLSEGFR